MKIQIKKGYIAAERCEAVAAGVFEGKKLAGVRQRLLTGLWAVYLSACSKAATLPAS